MQEVNQNEETMANSELELKRTLKRVAKRLFKKRCKLFFSEDQLNADFNLFLDRFESQEDRDQIQSIIDSLDQPKCKGMVLMGAVGCGKTSAMAQIYKRRHEMILDNLSESMSIKKEDEVCQLERIGKDGYLSYSGNVGGHILWDIDIRVLTHEQLITRLREYKRAKEIDPRISPDILLNSRILMIDDFEDNANEWNLILQDAFIDHRWKNKLPTFITTNFTASALRKMDGYQRIVDRIGDPKWMMAYEVPGGSWRK